MSNWNNFVNRRYKEVLFSELKIGDKFRNDFFDGKRRRKDIICIKIGDMEFIEERSKKIHKFKLYPENYKVCSFDEIVNINECQSES